MLISPNASDKDCSELKSTKFRTRCHCCSSSLSPHSPSQWAWCKLWLYIKRRWDIINQDASLSLSLYFPLFVSLLVFWAILQGLHHYITDCFSFKLDCQLFSFVLGWFINICFLIFMISVACQMSFSLV